MSSSSGNLNLTIGAHEIGVLVSIFLFGLITVQTFSYYRKFPDDSWYLKSYVAYIWIIELAHSIFVAHSLYFLTILRYGDPEAITSFPVSLIGSAVTLGLIAPAIQSLFVHRIRVLSKNLQLAFVCWFLCFCDFTSTMGVVATMVKTRSTIKYKEDWLWLMVSALSISVLANVLITTSLSYILWRERRDSLKRTRRVVDHLIMWTIQTGLLPTLAAITMLITFVVLDDFTWIAVSFIKCRLFANSLLACLNARADLREIHNEVAYIGDSQLRIETAPSPEKKITVLIEKSSERWENGEHTSYVP